MPIVDVVMTINHTLSIRVTLPADEIPSWSLSSFIFIFVEFVAMQGSTVADRTFWVKINRIGKKIIFV
ncbi:hypothetical protein VNO80_21210 [Phaseolus coccineus]|uniref:Uncharacterized protein n=1 Tax=Phaseolus coccineus TaxID=3886 RepID=A0AAN9M7F3_PHACN